MNKEFVPYEEALALKEFGFDEPCFGFYSYSGPKTKNIGLIWYEMPNSGKDSIPVGDVLAPTYSQAFKFFREKHDLDYNIYPHTEQFKRSYLANIFVGTEEKRIVTENRVSIRFYSKEEAELECLRKLIQITKEVTA
jgi:hypothetical protein